MLIRLPLELFAVECCERARSLPLPVLRLSVIIQMVQFGIQDTTENF